ncbi:uncharacterized protein LOC135809361 [Sycon ciliatum]|uniref:uncharacterized protein LOC135809361 n=1 Tax=Sycon ciliatum TaxID=27933 RepID=UPI0031F6A523
MSFLARSQYIPRFARAGRPVSISCVRLASSTSPPVPPSSAGTGHKSPGDAPPTAPAPQRVATNSNGPSGAPAPQPAPSSSTASSSSPSSSSSSSSSSSGNSGNGGAPPPPPDPPKVSLLERYRVLFIGTLAVISVSLVLPNFIAYQAVQDARKKRDSNGLPRSSPSSSNEEETFASERSVSDYQNSSKVTPVLATSVAAVSTGAMLADSDTAPAEVVTSDDGDETKGAAGGAASSRSSAQSKSENNAVAADSTYVQSENATTPAEQDTGKSSESPADSHAQSVTESTQTDKAATDKVHGGMNEQELEALATQLKQKLESSKKEAVQNVDDALVNVNEVVTLAQGLYKSAVDSIKELTMRNFRSIEIMVKGDASDVLAENEASINQLRQELADCQSKVEDVCTNLPARVAALDRAASVVQAQGDVAAANAASQQASDALKSLHAEAEQVAQARADLAVMEEYYRQVKDRIARYQQHMSSLQSAQLEILHKAAKSEDETESSNDQQQQSVYGRDVQTLLSYAQQRVDVMEQKLSSGQERQAKDVTVLLEQQRAEDARVMQLKLDHLRQQMEREHAEDLQAKDVEARYRLEEELKLQMKRQAAAHTDHLQSSLQTQAKQLTDDWRWELELELRAQAVHHDRSVQALSSQVQHARDLLLSTADTVQSNHSSHKLWQTCSSLCDSMANAKACPALRPFVDDVRTQVGGDSFISAALDSIPAPALDTTLQSEPILRQRYETLRRNCQRVAMVPEDAENGFWTYSMSYVRSWFVFPRRNLSLDTVDLSSMDTIDLLALCDREMREGSFEVAVRVLNQLRGQPRVLAQDWLDKARLLLETRQALALIQSQLLLGASPSSAGL